MTSASASPPPSASPAIAFIGVGKSFGAKRVLADLTLSVAAGEVFALLGANGAGKTTAITILTTLLRPDSGTVEIGGIDVATDPAEARRRFAVTGQSAAVDPRLTARENLVLLARLSGLSRAAAKTRTADLAAQLSLTSFLDARVGTLSGGMRRRLDLALSLVVPVDVLILDEPTTGLDTRSRRELWDEVSSLAREGTTVFLTTQYLEEADALADRIGLLSGGRLAGLGTPAELKSLVGEDTVVVSDAATGREWEAPTDGTAAAIAATLNDLGPDFAEATVSLRRPSLDDVFLALTGGDSAAHPGTGGPVSASGMPTPTTTKGQR